MGDDRVEDVLGSIRKLVADEAAQRRARWAEAHGLPPEDTDLEATLPAAPADPEPGPEAAPPQAELPEPAAALDLYVDPSAFAEDEVGAHVEDETPQGTFPEGEEDALLLTPATDGGVLVEVDDEQIRRVVRDELALAEAEWEGRLRHLIRDEIRRAFADD